MNLNKKLTSQLLIIICLVTLPSVLPLKAVSQSPQTEENFGRKKEPGGGRTWEEIETVFLNKSGILGRPKRSGGSRGENRGNTELCLISPQSLVDQDTNNTENINNDPIEVWSNRPLFIWQANNAENNPIEVLLYQAQDANSFWSQEVDTDDNFIMYNDETPLAAGKIYQWHLLKLDSQFPDNSTKVAFKIIEAEEREVINQDLLAIEQQLQGESAEKIALKKANYFIAKDLWSDALQVMFSVENPSAELQQAIDRIKFHNFCQLVTDSGE